MALSATQELYDRYEPGQISHDDKHGGDPVTALDLGLDHVLREALPLPGDGWLSEETRDDLTRLTKDLTWVVDPLDGTKEFIKGIPEYCTSVAAVVNGEAIAGGIYNPAADIQIVGGVGHGVLLNGSPASPMHPAPLEEMTVLASRSEVTRGQWARAIEAGVAVIAMGSVAYKLARVAAGLNHATWTLVPKHEWDVAGGSALLNAIGGSTVGLDGERLSFNQSHPWFDGVIAVPPGFSSEVPRVLTFRQ